MKFCRNCGTQMEDSAAFCTKCGARQETPGQPSAQGQIVRFQRKNITGESIGLALMLMIGCTSWIATNMLSNLFDARVVMIYRLLLLLAGVSFVFLFVYAVWAYKQVYLQLEQGGVSGVYFSSMFNIFKTEAFRFSYREIEDVKASSLMGMRGVISLKIQGKWRNIAIDQSMEAKQLIGQRRAWAR